MENNNTEKFIEDYINKLKNNEVNQLYNLQNKNDIKPHLIQFNQLITYFNFRKKLEEQLNKENNYDIDDNSNRIKCYLIDKNWFEKWKRHVGYKEIINEYKMNKINGELNHNDYNWIEPIISKNSSQNYLSQLDNNAIYQNNDINPLAEFIIIDDICYKYFSLGSKKLDNNRVDKYYPTKIFKEKIIIKLSNKVVLLIFNEKEIWKRYYQLIIGFNDENQNFRIVLDDIKKNDTNKWIKYINFDINSDKKKLIDKYNFKFEIINKSLIVYQNDRLKNSLFPTLNNGVEDLLNKDGSISKKLEELMKEQMTSNLENVKLNFDNNDNQKIAQNNYSQLNNNDIKLLSFDENNNQFNNNNLNNSANIQINNANNVNNNFNSNDEKNKIFCDFIGNLIFNTQDNKNNNIQNNFFNGNHNNIQFNENNFQNPSGQNNNNNLLNNNNRNQSQQLLDNNIENINNINFQEY